MSKKLFITRTDHDVGNAYLYAYSQEILNEAESRGWKVERSEKKDANRKTVISRLKNNPDFIVFNGHGTKDEICGYGDERLLGAEDGAFLKGTVSFIRSCSSLEGLGKNAVRNGAKAVVGYRGDFWIPRINKYEATPLRDVAAKPVLDASNSVALHLLKGSSVRTAVVASRQKSDATILKLLTSDEPYGSASLRALIYNNNVLGFEGDEDASA